MQPTRNREPGRRDLLGGGVAIIAGVARSARSGVVAVRRDAAGLRHSPRLLATLEAAIGEMQRRSERDPNDPKGWRVHSQAHHAVCAAVANDADDQVHGSWWFLPWHRAYLAVTEWKLQAISGDPTLALPYWNWSSDRTIPTVFSRKSSPLANAVRHTPDRLLTAAEVDYLVHDDGLARLGVAGLGARAFQATAQEQIPLSFGGIAKPNPGGWHGRSRLEGVPHNAIHNYVGGEAADGSLGDMTELSSAARDPLFLAHHANLDRLWEHWRSDPMRRASEPTDRAFLDHRFPFPWLDGSIVTISVADTLEPRRLGYVYDQLAVFRDGQPPPDRPEWSKAWPALTIATVRLPPSARATGCILRITGVEPGSRPLSVQVALAQPGRPATAINVGAFAIGRRHNAPAYPDTELRFDVSAAAARLGTPTADVVVLPLTLGSGDYQPPAFAHSAIEIVASPARITP